MIIKHMMEKWVDGYPHGKGYMELPNGDTYEGQFKICKKQLKVIRKYFWTIL